VEVWGSSPHERTIHFVNTDAVFLRLTTTHAKAAGALTPYLLLATSEILNVWACVGPCTTRQSTTGFNGPAKPFSLDHVNIRHGGDACSIFQCSARGQEAGYA
jgi:hypothetical protein